MSEPLLDIRDLRVEFRNRGRVKRAVDGVSLAVEEGECVGLVGESGCGKTTLARCVVGLLEPTSGTIRVNGRHRAALAGRERRRMAREVQMVFQDPVNSLNPRQSVRSMLSEALRVHRLVPSSEREARCVDLLESVGMHADHLDRYPHEFSGGQRQRIGIARALAVGPRLLIADEPVSALDVSVQAQILNLLADLRSRYGLTLLFVAHDLAVVRYLCERVAVMRNGRLIESGPVETVYERPADPYTRALLDAIPAL